jgi:hypothetical protein
MNQDTSTPSPAAQPSSPSNKALTRRGFVARLQAAAVIAPMAVAAIATLPKARAGS